MSSAPMASRGRAQLGTRSIKAKGITSQLHNKKLEVCKGLVPGAPRTSSPMPVYTLHFHINRSASFPVHAIPKGQTPVPPQVGWSRPNGTRPS